MSTINQEREGWNVKKRKDEVTVVCDQFQDLKDFMPLFDAGKHSEPKPGWSRKFTEAKETARNQFGMPLWMLVLVACGVPIDRLVRIVVWARKWRKR